MQTRDIVKIIKLPTLQASPLCPVQAVKNLLLLTPGNQDTSLFQIKNDKAQWIHLTDTKVRRNFSQILQRLGLNNSSMSLHTFRRSGATLAFNSNVSIQNIQSHSHGGRVVTLSPPTSEAGDRSPYGLKWESW